MRRVVGWSEKSSAWVENIARHFCCRICCLSIETRNILALGHRVTACRSNRAAGQKQEPAGKGDRIREERMSNWRATGAHRLSRAVTPRLLSSFCGALKSGSIPVFLVEYLLVFPIQGIDWKTSPCNFLPKWPFLPGRKVLSVQ